MARAERIIARLTELADRERSLLISGRLEDLAGLEAPKRHLVALLSRHDGPIDPLALGRLQRRAVENHQLYQAALIGVRQVRDQVARLLSSGDADLKTYSARGGRQGHARPKGKLERRA